MQHIESNYDWLTKYSVDTSRPVSSKYKVCNIIQFQLLLNRENWLVWLWYASVLVFVIQMGFLCYGLKYFIPREVSTNETWIDVSTFGKFQNVYFDCQTEMELTFPESRAFWL